MSEHNIPPLKTRLTSRKFWLTVVTSLLALFLDIPPETAALIIGGVVGSYSIGNGLQKRGG